MIPNRILNEDLMNEIEPGLWLGNVYSARLHYGAPEWTVLDVRESQIGRARNVVSVPILRKSTDWRVGRRALEEAAEVIDRELAKGQRVLVHCWAGMERSPLTLAYWLVTRRGHTLQSAYALLRSKRRVVINRSEWLTRKARALLTAPQRGTVAA